VSGDGAHPFQSAWLESGGEMPSRLIENHLFAGRVDDKTDEELRVIREAGISAFKARKVPLRTQLNGLMGNGVTHGSIHLTAMQDQALVTAAQNLHEAVDPRIELRSLEKFNPSATARIAELQGQLPARLALEQNYFNARAANSTVAALDAEKLALEVSMRPDQTIEAERDVKLAADELKRRGKPVGLPGP
jgi:hypothetical protein